MRFFDDRKGEKSETVAESDEASAQNGSWIFGAHRSTVYFAVGVQFCLGCVAL